MQYSDWKNISSLGYVLGCLFLIGGFFAYYYFEERWPLGVQPFRDYAVPLIVLGIVLLVVGYVAGKQAEKEEKRLALDARAHI